MIVLIGISIASAFVLFSILRFRVKSFWLSFLITAVVIDLTMILYSYIVGGLFEETFSLFENFRVIFLFFIGAMCAELGYLLFEDVSSLKEE